jgi:hypothetical protein
MSMRFSPPNRTLRPGLLLAAAACGLSLLIPAGAFGQEGKGDDKSAKAEPPTSRSHPDRMPNQPTVAPAFSIPVESLGFSAPATFYRGQRFALVSLDFLDEDRLLFSFRVPGLIHRQRGASVDEDGDERHMKAVVLSLPEGTVQAEAVWSLHDRSRYLWMLKDGRFLVRDRNELRLGDASLELKPYLSFPGPLLHIEMDPAQDLLVTNSREPAQTAKAGEAPSAGKPKPNVASDSDADKDQEGQPDLVLRILQRNTGKVMLVSHVRSAVHLPINSDGYLELLPGARNADWLVNLNGFHGGSAKVGEIDSTCSPSYDFLSQREFLVSACTRSEMRRYVAMSTDGRRLWEDLPSSSPVWPVMVVGADGSRLARESLVVNRPVTAFSQLDFDDIKGQLAEVFDAATGKIVLTAPLSPVFDAGGNVAISPSGRRVAVLNAGAIQVFDLPAPAVIPTTDSGEIRASKTTP